MNIGEWVDLRYGMFIHYGLYSRLARGEWVMNREGLSREELRELADDFRPTAFDADALCRLAVDGGMKYLVFGTMHHEGFRLYDSALSDFNSVKYAGRDLTAEVLAAARRHGLGIGLYHSLNNWFDAPDAVDALESETARDAFLDHTFARLRELAERYKPFDIFWYDGWWPFNAEGWRAEKMNAMLRAVHPDFLFNNRNCLPGDFGTPEGNLVAPTPWRPWEVCMTLNDHWGFHQHDTNWKPPLEVVKLLLQCANQRGNLLLNIGPRGDGSIPEESVRIVRQVGRWLADGGREAVANTEMLHFTGNIRRPDERGDWDPQGVFTVSGERLYFTLMYYPGPRWTIRGLECRVNRIRCGDVELRFEQHDDRLTLELPEALAERFCPVLRFDCVGRPGIYRTGGMRTPNVEHPRYDPVPVS